MICLLLLGHGLHRRMRFIGSHFDKDFTNKATGKTRLHIRPKEQVTGAEDFDAVTKRWNNLLQIAA